MATRATSSQIDDIKFITDSRVQPVVASEAAIKKAIDKAYDSVASFENVMKGWKMRSRSSRSRKTDTPDVTLLGEAEQARSSLVNSLITDAVRKGASDIHIERTRGRSASGSGSTGSRRDMVAPVPHEGGDHFPFENHGRAGHRRAARSPGRSHQAAASRPHHRPARLQPPDDLRREGRDANSDKGTSTSISTSWDQEQPSAISRVPSRSRTAWCS